MAGFAGTTKWSGRVVVVVTAVCAGSLVLIGLSGCTDSSTDVPAPEPDDAQQTVAELARAYDAHGICYGWRLTDGSLVVSQGSNLGVDVPASADQSRCARRVELQADVHYTPETSEELDSVTYRITTSG